MTRRGAVAVAITVVAVSAAGVMVRPLVHGLSLVVRAADLRGTARTLANLDTVATSEREFRMPVRGADLRARVYEPDHGFRRTALLVSGLHASGIDEPRLRRLSRELAASGVAVVTPDIPELSRFEITPAITDAIEAIAGWIAGDLRLAPDGRVGIVGISFSGGLSIVAAGRPSLAKRIAYVFALGGHDDLPRVLRYLCTGAEPYPPGQIRLKTDHTDAASSGLRLPPSPEASADRRSLHGGGQPELQSSSKDVFVRMPHDYGVAIILHGVAGRLVPPAQVEPLREAVRRYLRASELDDRAEKAEAAREFDGLRELARALPEPSATLLRYVVDRDVVHLGQRLLPYVGFYGDDPALSVSRSPKPTAPVFLLHGVDDNVIPSIESEYLADDLRPHAPVHLLMTPVLTHADANANVRTADVLRLAGFWGDLLSR